MYMYTFECFILYMFSHVCICISRYVHIYLNVKLLENCIDFYSSSNGFDLYSSNLISPFWFWKPNFSRLVRLCLEAYSLMVIRRGFWSCQCSPPSQNTCKQYCRDQPSSVSLQQLNSGYHCRLRTAAQVLWWLIFLSLLGNG